MNWKIFDVFMAALVVAGLTVIAAIAWHAANWTIAEIQPATMESCMLENMRGQPSTMQQLVAGVCFERTGGKLEPTSAPPATP
jgi:hypothetical protein